MKLSSVVISLFLIVAGFSLVVDSLFGLNVPILPIVIGASLIFWGCRRMIRPSQPNENSSIFSKAFIDLNDYRGTHFYNFYLSDITLRIPSNIPTRIILKSAASSIVLPAPHAQKNGSILINTQTGQNPELTLQIYIFAGSIQILQ